MQAVILAGGFGTRLSHVVKDVPKPMAPIRDIPFLKYQYDYLVSRGFDSFVLLTGYKSNVIEDYFRDYSNVVCIREETPLGTAGALLNAYEHLEPEFLLLNGDTFFSADFSLLYDCKKRIASGPSAMLALKYTENIDRYGFVEISGEYGVERFIEKGALPADQIDGYINAGAYLMDRELLTAYLKDFNRNFISLETELFPRMIENGQLYGLPLGGSFIDIGIPDDYYRAQDLIPSTMALTPRPALFIDKDGTLIVDSGYVHGDDFRPILESEKMVEEYVRKGYYLVLITNQAGVAKNKFSEDDMNRNIELLLKHYEQLGLKFDDAEYCTWCAEAVLEKYRFRSLARKPYPGMILKACEKLPIDLRHSVMVGDKPDVDRIALPYLECIIVEPNRGCN